MLKKLLGCVCLASALAITVACSVQARANVGVVIYESKGADARRTSTGHIALITTTLCPAGIDHLRRCDPGEKPGAIVTRYANVAFGYVQSLFVAPVRDHFTATSDPSAVPALSSGGTLEAMQMEYWRLHLKSYFPPLSQEQYHVMREELDRFDAGRTFRRTITMDYLIALLGPHKKRYGTEPIAIIHPDTGELIPNGRWRESIGVQHMRNSLIITASTSPEQEERLLSYVRDATVGEFNALTDNCSDFVANSLVAVFGDSGLRLRPRVLHVADAWITTPIAVATDFLVYAKRQNVPLHVQLVPMMAGTRRPTAAITSISRGALVPDASQGKLAFSMKVYFNTLNPLLGLLSFGADQASRFVDLQKMVHERGSEDLSRITNTVPLEPALLSQHRLALKREQMRVFGTSSCWRAKQEQFAKVAAHATEVGVLSSTEKSLLLKTGQPFLLPRLYERTAADRGSEGALLAGMQDCLIPSCGRGFVSSLLPGTAAKMSSFSGTSRLGFVPGRAEVRELANWGDRNRKVMAFKLMTAVINYDLSSEPVVRRTAKEFDPDWQLYIEVAQENGIHLADGDGPRETLGTCSCREFDAGTAKTDGFQQDRSIKNRLARQGRGLLHSANR